jgi:hypothetical protein
MRYWLLFLAAGLGLVGIVAFVHSDRAADTLLAMVVFAAISVAAWEPLQPGTSDRA